MRRMVRIRQALPADKDRILELTQDIWGGDDYIPTVIDDWLQASDGVVLVAELDRIIRGLGRLNYLSSQEGWFEGLRVEPGYQGLGIAKALTAQLLAKARERGRTLLQGSILLDEDGAASRHIMEYFGFQAFAYFQLFQYAIAPGHSHAAVTRAEQPQADLVSMKKRIARSRFLALSRGLLSLDWTFPTWPTAQQTLIGSLHPVYQSEACLIYAASTAAGTLAVSIWEADSDGEIESSNQALLHWARDHGFYRIRIFVPQCHPLQPLLPELGWQSETLPGRPNVVIMRHRQMDV